MRLWALTLFFSLPSLTCLAQYTNSWVSHNQTYYKISVATTGIYRLTYDQLQDAGVPVNSIDPRLIQIFHRGEEQAIYFKHNQQPANGQFENGEYLEFYGERNNGELDSKLYQPASAQPHKYYNLYSDTSAYFLTVNPFTTQGKRMEEFDNVNSGIPKETFHNAEQLRVFGSEYSNGDTRNTYVIQSVFDSGEGWTGSTICTGTGSCVGVEQRDFAIDQLTDAITSQSPPGLEIQLTGRDALHHQVEIYVGSSAGSLRALTTKNFDDFETPTYQETLQWSDIGSDGRLVVRVKAIGLAGQRDWVSVAYIKIFFAQGFDLASASSRYFNLNQNAGSGGKAYIELENAPAGTRLWDITDLSSIVLIGTHPSASLLTAVVKNTSSARKLYAASSFMTPALSQIREVTFTEIDLSAQFIIVSNQVLLKPGGNYANPVQAFADYRASQEGGGYRTLVVTVDQLYDQFNYGETSPLAITEFMRYIVGNGDPRYLFLIGKGRDVSAAMYRRTLSPTESRDLVPPGGSPGSDVPFTAGMKGDPFVPAISTGRLPAVTPQQVADYLDKVIETEATPYDDLSRKKILHLSGGKELSQLVLFRGYMDGFADIARGNYLGGTVATVSKRGVSDIEIINVADQINAGVNLVTFFGHSAPNITDIDIGNADNPVYGYDNKGKYPAFLMNGCNAGEYFNDGESFGENWMLIGKKGARNFIANSSFGFELVLRSYTTYFYQVAFADSAFLSTGIGDVQKEVGRRLLTDFGNSKSVYTAQVQQMVLLGDPALKLFAPTKPDYETSDEFIDVTSFDGKPVHALTDSLQVQIITRNFGRGTKADLDVKIIHSIDDVVTEYNARFVSPVYEDTLRFTIKRGSGNFYGNNKIDVILDPDNKIAELNEDNNTGRWSKVILFNGTQNLQPGNYSIVNTTSVDALFQDTDVLSPERTYQVEFDTTKNFNSPFVQSKTVTGKILLKTHFDLLEVDSTVYYWRTKPVENDQWAVTSFTYINNGPEGWTQRAYEQLFENTWDGLVGDPEKRDFNFDQTGVSFTLRTLGSDFADPGVTPSLLINNSEYYYSPIFPCRNNTINLVAFDRNSVHPYAAVAFDFSNSGGRSCGLQPQIINSFTASETDTGNGDDLIQYIDNLKVSDSVVLFTVGDAGFTSWSSLAKTKLEEIGLAGIDFDTFQQGEPIIILGRKGALPGKAKIIRSSDPDPQAQQLQVSDDLTGYLASGSIESVLIGPALKWHDMKPVYQRKEVSDEAGVDVYIVDKTGEASLYSYQTQGSLNISNVDASQYPFIRLIYRTSDDDNLTPAPLKNWLVSYDPAPDGILIPGSAIEPVTIPEGVVNTTDFAFVNISKIDFKDSLLSVFTIINRNKRIKESVEFRIQGPAAGDTVRFSRSVNSVGKVGLNDLSAAVNTGFVPEQYLTNNSIELSSYLNVLKDEQNPVLEVTIDGRFVNDGDFVSSNPIIKIILRDDNKLLMLKDTTSLSLFMSDVCENDECQPKRVAFSGANVKWTILETGELEVIYTPKDLADGKYLLLANGTDVTGNPSGQEEYSVSFVVDRDPGLIFYDPYPNPSPVGFYFEFTATGESAPEGFVLQIIDRIGQHVARFTDQNAPPLRVGRNQLHWTGLDAQGNRISDGLYFYQLTVISDGNRYKNSGRIMIVR